MQYVEIPVELRIIHSHTSQQAATEKSENLFLYIDLPRFDFPVIFNEPVRLLTAHICTCIHAEIDFGDAGSNYCLNLFTLFARYYGDADDTLHHQYLLERYQLMECC